MVRERKWIMKLTRRQRELLQVIAGAGGWMSRAAIAHAGGRRPPLSHNDLINLERLIAAGLIEHRQADIDIPPGYRHEYRAAAAAASLLAENSLND
jgi:hypothetical protein